MWYDGAGSISTYDYRIVTLSEDIIIRFNFHYQYRGDESIGALSMEKVILKQITPGGRALGIVMIVIGVAMLLASLAANNDAAAIGASTDPVLSGKFTDLTHLRDLYGILGISALFLGAFSLIILTERSINPLSAEAEMVSQARVSSQILKGLNLHGNAAYVSKRGAMTIEKVFIPATRGKIVLPKSLTDDLIMSPGSDGSTPGALISPTGMDMLLLCEKEAHRSCAGIGLAALENDLQTLKYGFGLLKDFHVKESGEFIIVRVEYSGAKEACKTVRTELPDTCRQMSCFGCSCIMTGVSKAIGQSVRVEEADNSEDRVTFRLARL